MKKIKIKICNGTTCFVMGSAKLQDLEARIPALYKKYLDIRTQTCLNLCHNDEHSKSPYVMVEDEVISEATIEKIISVIEKHIQKINLGEDHE